MLWRDICTLYVTIDMGKRQTRTARCLARISRNVKVVRVGRKKGR